MLAWWHGDADLFCKWPMDQTPNLAHLSHQIIQHLLSRASTTAPNLWHHWIQSDKQSPLQGLLNKNIHKRYEFSLPQNDNTSGGQKFMLLAADINLSGTVWSAADRIRKFILRGQRGTVRFHPVLN